MGRRESFSVGVLNLIGISKKVGTPTVTVLARNAAGHVLIAAGATVPTDTDVGYATGAMFIKTDTGAIYYNVGTAASANFDLQGVLAPASVSLEHLDSGITAGFRVFYAGNKTTAGGGASEDIAVANMLETDIPMACIKDNGTNNVTLLQTIAKAGGGAITVTFSGDPANDCILNVVVLRATS